MLRIRVAIILGLLLSCGWASSEDYEEQDLFDILMDTPIVNKQFEKLESTTTEKTIDDSLDDLKSFRSLYATPKAFDESKILHYEEMQNLGCGFANPKSSQSFNEQPVDAASTGFGEFNWIIRINYKNDFIGCGTLIAPDIVLTAASLIEQASKESLTVVAGEWDVSSENEIYPHLIRTVDSVIQHPHFDGFVNDIALLVLRTSFSRQPNIHTICLATPATVVEQDRCLSLAWNSLRSLPQQYRLAMQPSDVCSQRLSSPYVHDKQLDSGFICATHLDDSSVLNVGAALFCPMRGTPNRYTQTGIVIGSTNRTGIMTGLFVNVNHFMPWIFMQLGPRGTELRHYLPFV